MEDCLGCLPYLPWCNLGLNPGLAGHRAEHGVYDIVALGKAELNGRSVAICIPYRFYVGTHNENHDSMEQKRVFGSLGEDFDPSRQHFFL